MNDYQKNIELLMFVSEAMKDLKDKVVFIGGITTFAYLDSAIAVEVRPTEDVDCTIEITSLLEYKELEKKLLSLNFKHDCAIVTQICRWQINGIKVDIIPSEEKILGFSNKWYPEGIKNKIKFILPSGMEIYIFSHSYFIASKLEAYYSRGQGDPRTSTDIEDIILVLDGAIDIADKIRKSDNKVQSFIAQSLLQISENGMLSEAIEGAFSREGIGRLNKIKKIVESLKSIN